MEAFDLVFNPAKNFIKECHGILKICTLPSAKVLKKTAQISGIGFLVLGGIGFVAKLISIPINNVIIGSMAN